MKATHEALIAAYELAKLVDDLITRDALMVVKGPNAPDDVRQLNARRMDFAIAMNRVKLEAAPPASSRPS